MAMDYEKAKRQKARIVLDIEDLAASVNDSEAEDSLKEIARNLDRIHINWYE